MLLVTERRFDSNSRFEHMQQHTILHNGNKSTTLYVYKKRKEVN